MITKSTSALAPTLVITGVSLSMAATPQRWQFKEDKLDNGMRIFTMEDRRTPLVSIQVWYHVGSKDENPERQGFAHMFEHMMFRGTDRIGPQDHFKYLNRYGARVNGYTSFDMTVYWETLPSSQFDRAMWLEAERLGRLKINEDYFAAEREVVKEERRMRYLNRPYGKLYETLFSSAFKVHPYRWTPIGNMPHLDASTAEELQAFFNKYYVPNNATLVVVGDVSHEQVMKRAREYFGPLARKGDPPRVTAREPEMTAPRRVEIRDIAPSPMVVHAYHAPSARDQGDIAMDLLSRILSTGQSSRLYRHLVQDKEIAVSTSGSNWSFEQAGLFYFSAILKRNVTVEQGEAALKEEVRLLLEKGIEPAELEKAKNQAIAEKVRDGETVQGRADQLGYAAVILGDANRVNTDLEAKREITAEQIMAVARRVFRDDNRIELIIQPDPKSAADEETTDSAKKAEQIAELPPPPEMPTGKAPGPVELPRPASRKLANGLNVVVFEDPSTPAVTITCNMLIGAKDDPADQAGLASVTAALLRRGTSRHSGPELAEMIDSHAMSLSETVDHNDTNLRLWTLGEYTDLAVEILAEVLREPVFPAREVANYVTRVVDREKINEKDAGTLANRAINRTLYGDYYLSRPEGGTSASLARITRDQVAAFHRETFGPANASLVFAGAITPDRAFELAERLLGDWKRPPAVDRKAPPPPATDRTVVVIDREGAVQSEIRIAQLVNVSRRDPDYAAIRLLSQLFGESFSGRLNKSLRIEKGLTYGSSGYFDVDKETAAFRMSTFTRTERTADAIKAMLEEVERLRAGTITADELDAARDTLLGNFQMALETPAQIAARWWDLIVWGLPEDWYAGYLRAVSNVKDPKALDEAARSRLQPAKLAIVVAGDAGKLEKDLKAFGEVTTAPAE